MLAVFKTGGKQYAVKEGQILKVEKVNGKKGDNISFSEVLAISNSSDSKIGSPLVENAIVQATIVDQVRDKKIIVFKKRRRQNSRKRYGHRQPLSKIQITKILSKGGKVVSEIKADKIKLSNDQKSDKKLGIKKQEVTKKAAKKKTVVKTKTKK